MAQYIHVVLVNVLKYAKHGLVVSANIEGLTTFF